MGRIQTAIQHYLSLHVPNTGSRHYASLDNTSELHLATADDTEG